MQNFRVLRAARDAFFFAPIASQTTARTALGSHERFYAFRCQPGAGPTPSLPPVAAPVVCRGRYCAVPGLLGRPAVAAAQGVTGHGPYIGIGAGSVLASRPILCAIAPGPGGPPGP